ncbi:SPOC like C-terminal domain-containing protein [Zychaea mexicana]|uniref:SPOC like C-terminal domain-containing protein n=1 Tax=Zychaea mexicana TaxID=64656 RepID=UPI0022FDD198|nr:SPOC like C-terminal domain-containing protein [Zychaea mexicana]KAI9497325.1 SPOC like C-terminal domain-containing protein [Zychaea mexicana]
MANKKATVYILDSGPSMGKWLKLHEATAFQKSKEVIQTALEEKLLAGRKTDQVSIVIAGTEESDNHLAVEQPGQYQHITVMSQIKQPDLELVRKFVNVPLLDSKENSADPFDAVILTVAMIKDYVRHLKFEKRIRLFTTLEGNVNWDNIEDVNQMLRGCGIEISIACLGLSDAEELGNRANERVKTNLENWKQLMKDVPNGFLIDLMDAIEESTQFHKKEVRPTPTYRGYLTFGDRVQFPDTSLSVSINMYARTMEAKVPSAGKWSSISNVTGTRNEHGAESHQVASDTVYKVKHLDSGKHANNEDNDNADDSGHNDDNHANEDENIVVEKSELAKAYNFGKEKVVVSPDTEEHLKLKTEPCMTVLGIYHKKAFPPQLQMSNVYTIVGGSDQPVFAAKAISAFAQALGKNNWVALVRHVSRANVPPRLGILKPVLREDIDALYFVRVPFAEDYRDFTFSSLDKVFTESGKEITEDHPLLPTQDVRDAMSAFVKGMTIKEPVYADDDKGDDETDEEDAMIEIDEIYNPQLWLTQKAMIARALNPAAAIPELDPRLKQQFDQPAKLIAKNKNSIENLKRVLNVKKVDRASKRKRYGGIDADQGVPENLLPLDQVLQTQQQRVPEMHIKQEEQTGSEIRALFNKETREITMENPKRDFTNMINNREEDLVTSAVEQMCVIITKLVTQSFGDRDYEQAFECLECLRSTAAKEDESEAFNKYLYQLKNTCDPSNPQSHRRGFWDIMKNKRLTLITNEEAPDSNVTSGEARTFLEEEKPTRSTGPQESMDDDNGPSNEDLFDMLE